MRKQLDEALCAKYPLIFKDRNADMRTTAMCWGIECGDGWYNIIDVLCGLLTSEYRQAKSRYDYLMEAGVGGILYGTKTVTQEAIDDAKVKLDEETLKVPVASQVKEKFGGLRFYVQAATDKHHQYITFAESMSYRICESCGAEGKTYTDGWHTTLCDIHAAMAGKEEEYEYEENE
jgi:CDGSH-type Zn-finger protein